MAIGRITGPLLTKNLLRDGVDLAFETDLLYLDVNNGRIGIRKSKPSYELDVNGTVNAKNLRVTYTEPGSGTAQIGKLVLSAGTITTEDGPITIQPSGNDSISLIGDTTVTGNLHATGNITADGDIVLGNNTSVDTVIFESAVKSNITPAENAIYNLGSSDSAWLDAYVENVITNHISSRQGNISISPEAGLLEINSEIKVSGRNPIGTAPVISNVLWVTMDGNDTNDGRAADPSRACKTISGAIKSPYYRPGTLIRVMSGHYLENNPILLQPNTAVVGDDLRTTSIEPINKTQDLFHVQSGCYVAQMQFSNGRSGLLPGQYAPGSNRGAYCTAFPPQVKGTKIDLYHSPYIQNCTNQSGPWLIDGTLFVPNQTVQFPTGFGTTTFSANTNTLVVTLTTGTIKVGDYINSGPQDPGFQNARTLILANKEFIKEQIIAFVDFNYPDFVYEKSKCARDVGIILENVTYDAAFGGNEKSVESGLGYYDGVINLIEGQQEQTTAAINYVNTLSQYIIRNEVAPVITGTNLTQTINTALTGGVVAAEEITAGIDIITLIINSGTSYAPTIFKSCGPETPLVSAETLLQANRKFLQEEVTAYVDATYPNFEYKRESCYRDVGLLVDAVSQDILIGGNTKSIEAGMSYYTGSKGDSSVAEQSIINSVELLKNIINTATFTLTNTATVVGPNLGTGYSNAKDLLIKNRNFVQSEVSAYVRSLFDENFRLTQVQQNLCYRDIGLIVDAIAEDTAAGGNVNVVTAGLAYYTGNTNILPGDQPTKTNLALDYLLLLCRNIIKNKQNTNLYQTRIPQITNLQSATETESDSIGVNLDLISDIITLGPDVVTNPRTPISLNLTTNTNSINAFKILQANRDFLATEVTGFIDDVFGSGFNYDADKCSRDTGLIVDGLAFDLLYQGNSQSIFAGIQYFNQGSSAIPNEETTTTNAINYAKLIAKEIIVNTTVTNYQNSSTQVFDLINPGSTSTVDTIDSLFNTVTNIIVNGTAGITNQIIPNGNASIDTDIVNAYTLLQANRTFIQDEVIAYVDATNESFIYDRDKCSRDVGLIVDSISQDLLFVGSSQSNFAGLQYWGQGSTSIPGELTTTTDAIAYVRDLAIKIINNDQTGPRYQSALSQTTGTSATISESQKVYDEFNLILDIINNGTEGVTDQIIPNSIIASTDIDILNAYSLLQANRSYIRAEALAYVEAFRPADFVYDVAKCSRDVGYMIDSVSFDLKYGGNKQAIQSGVYYYGFDGVVTNLPDEIPQTIDAYNYIKELSSYIITGQRVPTQYQYNITQIVTTSTGTTSEITDVENNIDKIIDIIINGPGVADAPSPIDLTESANPNVINAARNISLNRDFIRAEVVAYIDQRYPVGFTYDKTKCRRDVGYIIDSISFDLLHGGNRQSIQSGVYYYRSNDNSSVLTYEKTQAIAAYNHIKNISKDIIKGIAVTTSTGNYYPQTILANTATDAEALLIAEGIGIINDIINNGTSGYIREPIGLIASSSTNVLYAYEQLLANREFIKSETIAYIDTQFKNNFIFDKIKCTRDTKLIVDSVALDLIYEGSTQSEFAGLQYWSQGATTIPGEITTTTDAISYVKSLALTYADIGSEQYTSIEDNFDLIINIINTGTSGVTDLVVPNNLPSTNTSTVAVYTSLLENKASIQNDTLDYISINHPGFVYNTSTCYRDVGYIIDCVAFDLLHGGNRQSIQAGVYYYGFDENTTNVPNEIPQTAAGYNYLKYLIGQVLQNNVITRSYQVVYPQIIIPAYMGLATVIPGQELITADAVNYLRDISIDVISNIAVTPVRNANNITQTINTFFDGGINATGAITRNYGIISDIILNGPSVAPPSFVGSGLFATTGISTNDVRNSPTVIEIISQDGNTATIKVSSLTLGNTYNGTLYFGETLIFPKQDSEIDALSLEYTGSTSTWNSRKVDPIGSMGGSLVDGAVISDRSPIQSFVYDAFTQITQGGRGIHITNNGYAQLVSVFTIFCSVGVQVDNGGIASIVNSNANFGDICLLAKGFGRREFSGTIYNPPFPTSLPNEIGKYYPSGYYPTRGNVEVYVPDTANRPHISLVMEVEPPDVYRDYLGNLVPYTNQQGYPGFLNAQPSKATLTTGTIVIDDIDTNGIAVGNTLYIRDRAGKTDYAATGTVVVDVNYRSVTINKGLTDGGGDPLNPEYITLYFCGKSYYTVLSSVVNDDFLDNSGNNFGDRVIPIDQKGPELDSINQIKTLLDGLMTTAGVDPAAITFTDNNLDTIYNIVDASDLTTAEAIVPSGLRLKKATPPVGASLAITVINDNIEDIVTSILTYVATTYPGIAIPTNPFNGSPLYASLEDYLSNKCARDVRLILRQLAYDLEFGGNYYSVYAGLSYWYRQGTHHVINLDEAVSNTALFPDGAIVNFYQRSYMSATGYVFEYVGAGTNYGALPQRGIKDPVQGKEVVQVDNGKVFFTSTDQNGDFRIGPGLVVSQATGVLSGRTFTRSLFANLTPFILAVEG